MSTAPPTARPGIDRALVLFGIASVPSRLGVLFAIASGPRRVSGLADLAGISLTAMSAILHRMRLAGLIECERHGRENHYVLTATGRRLIGFAADLASLGEV